MHITILGHGPLAEPIALLAARAGHTVNWAEEGAEPSDHGLRDDADLVILAGSSAALEPMMPSIRRVLSRDAVVVDAIIPTRRESPDDVRSAQRSEGESLADSLPDVRVIRAFASVPAEALSALLSEEKVEPTAPLAVPMAGDNRQAKALVSAFMSSIGVDPFDLGALQSARELDPGGALWGKALSQDELLEAVGWLSGDG